MQRINWLRFQNIRLIIFVDGTIIGILILPKTQDLEKERSLNDFFDVLSNFDFMKLI